MNTPGERQRSIPVGTDDGRRYLAVSVDGLDWLVVTEDAKLVGSFRSVAVTTSARLREQAIAVIHDSDQATGRADSA